MMYVDTSALLKRYVEEADSERAEGLLRADPDWVTARHTLVETRRNLTRLLVDPAARAVALGSFARDWGRIQVVELDRVTCETAAAIAETTGARTLDALHLAAAVRALGGRSVFLTFDHRLAQAARELDLDVRGA
jgi:predicted nucleic acid-binding protein